MFLSRDHSKWSPSRSLGRSWGSSLIALAERDFSRSGRLFFLLLFRPDSFFFFPTRILFPADRGRNPWVGSRLKKTRPRSRVLVLYFFFFFFFWLLMVSHFVLRARRPGQVARPLPISIRWIEANIYNLLCASTRRGDFLLFSNFLTLFLGLPCLCSYGTIDVVRSKVVKKEKKKKEGFKVRAQPLRKNDVSPKPLLLFSFRYFSTPCWLLPCVHQSGSHKNSILSSHFKRIDPLFSSDRKISLSLYTVLLYRL